MKRFTVIILSVIILRFITSCAKPNNKVEIYSFSGANDTIIINNGLIIVTDDIE